jgi:PiT family inorganic phosphate transporter
MIIGAAGISFGLLLFGPKLIRMVGEQITKLNPMRAYCVALSAAVTVIIASWFGLPVSSTHIAVGAVFGVGFFREWYTSKSQRRRDYMDRKYHNRRFRRGETGAAGQGRPARGSASPHAGARAHFTTIVAAWVITVPAAAILSAITFILLDAAF